MTRERPTILQIIPQLDIGGAELSTAQIAEALIEAGGRALVLTEGGRLAARITKAGGEIITFPAATKNPARLLLNAKAIHDICAREGVDLIHARSRAPAWSALLAARTAKLPFVTTYHGAYSEKNALKKLYNGVMARADVVIANSCYTAGLIRTRYGTPEDRVRVIYRGIDTERFDPAAIPAARIAALQEKWGVKDGERIVLNAGRLTGWKGQSVVIAAAARLAAQGKLDGVAVILAGDDQGRTGYADQLRAEIAAANLTGRVRLVGHCDDMPAAFAATHVAVVASVEPEAFGRAATEAEVMGCPVISTDIGAPPETVLAPPRVPAAERTGWLVPPGDAAALAAALDDALHLTPEARRQLGARARTFVLQAFTGRGMQKQTLQVYDALLGSALAARFSPNRA